MMYDAERSHARVIGVRIPWASNCDTKQKSSIFIFLKRSPCVTLLVWEYPLHLHVNATHQQQLSQQQTYTIILKYHNIAYNSIHNTPFSCADAYLDNSPSKSMWRNQRCRRKWMSIARNYQSVAASTVVYYGNIYLCSCFLVLLARVRVYVSVAWSLCCLLFLLLTCVSLSRLSDSLTHILCNTI